jgi:hypothetical protein
LDQYLNVTLHNKAFSAGIALVEVRLALAASEVGKLSILLNRLKNIDTFIFNIPGVSTARCERILKNLNFPNLVALFTKMVPHKGLIGFFRRHPQLSTLALGTCDESECPFDSVVTPSKCFTEIEGPTGCVSKLIAGSDLNRVTVTYQTPLDTHIHTFMSISYHNITVLALDFSPNHDQDILRTVAGAAPRVGTLHLTERFPNKNQVGFVCLHPCLHALTGGNNIDWIPVEQSASLVFRPSILGIPH